MNSLPIHTVLPEIRRELAQNTRLVLSAPPGAGKTTAVPPALLNEEWMKGRRIVMLEPRRLAARRAAEYISATLKTRVGGLVGYRVRGESKTSTETRIEIVTEGILSRMILKEQDLPGTGLVIFDEFHERSLHADMGLAFTLDLQKHLRPNLRILVMSATLDVAAVSTLLGDAPIVESTGRIYPVEVHHSSFVSDSPIEKRMAETILRASRAHEGDVLAFLPGIREIRRTDEELSRNPSAEDLVVHQLYGDAAPERQRDALEPDPSGRRKVILSTSIAETSVTIDGVRIVVDSGLARTVKYDVRRGMSALVTVPVSKAIADQRKGRAGRQAPGQCYRLWRVEDHTSLPGAPTPEIKATDLTPVALQLARWGDPYAETLSLLDKPPRPALEQSRTLLRDLGALDDSGALTKHGIALSEFPLHPRFAHMILLAARHGMGALACELAALLDERELPSAKADREVDVGLRWHAFHKGGKNPGSSSGADYGLAQRIEQQAKRYRQMAGVTDERVREDDTGRVLALAFPDRIGRRREEAGRYILTSGQTARLPKASRLERNEFLAVGFLDGAGADSMVMLAAPLTDEDVSFLAKGRTTEDEVVQWDTRAERVEARSVRKLGAVILDERKIRADDDRVANAMTDGVRRMGLGSLPWTRETESLIARSEWVRTHENPGEDWPDLSSDFLEKTLTAWLTPHLSGMTKRADLRPLDLRSILEGQFTFEQRKHLDTLAPSHVTVPSGSRIAIDYVSPDAPRLEVKLQEMFGLAESPRIGRGRHSLTVHLLSPARRPLAVTKDLASFWRTTYQEIRGQMRAKYPRHPWPEDPWKAEATRRTVKHKGTRR